MPKIKIAKALAILIAVVCLSQLHCTKESDETPGSIAGVVTIEDQGASAFVYPAYIFHNDSLLATTNELGEYTISSLEEGSYNLTCSALNYSDLMQQVTVEGGKTVTQNFALQSDDSRGILLGEFQDLSVFNDSLSSNPALAEWDDQQVYTAATGATIQAKWFPGFTGTRVIYLGNDSIGYADAWGQYAAVIQCGTYSFTGTCDGYKSKTHVVTIVKDTKTYLNFILERE